MSYAIETKKRKFERILESLTDGGNPSARATNPSDHKSYGTIKPSFGSDLSKRRRVTPSGKSIEVASLSTASLTTHYLPSSRLAFLERLESYRQITKWHVPSTSPVNAVEWAKRGWVCQDTDTVSCLSCKERLHVDIDVTERELGGAVAEKQSENDAEVEEDEDPLTVSNALLQNLTKKYQDLMITAHVELCPWKRRGCDDSIQRIEGLLNMPSAITSLQKRYDTMTEDFTDMPEVVALSSTEACTVEDHMLNQIRFSDSTDIVNVNALRLAVCGWQGKDEDIIECRNCFRSLGLWLYRGTEPTMEHLDPVDSHLEYCPWRSSEAQHTELTLISNEGQSAKEKLPGWLLVYLAIVKKNNKGRGSASRNATQLLEDRDQDQELPQLSPEQREKKMKDLMRRIRDLKKPFNVKSLLKRKDKLELPIHK